MLQRSIARRWLVAYALLCCALAGGALALRVLDLGVFGARPAANRIIASIEHGDADVGLERDPRSGDFVHPGEPALGFVTLVWKTQDERRPVMLPT